MRSVQTKAASGEPDKNVISKGNRGVHGESVNIVVLWLLWRVADAAPALRPVVEAEENVYTYQSANNGAGPLWCSGSTCLARIGGEIFASGLETLPDEKRYDPNADPTSSRTLPIPGAHTPPNGPPQPGVLPDPYNDPK